MAAIYNTTQTYTGTDTINFQVCPQYTSAGTTNVYPTVTFPAQVVAAPEPPQPRELTPLEWLDEQVAEVCELAWAA